MKALDPSLLAQNCSRQTHMIVNTNLDMLTTTETYRPQNLNMYIKFVM